MVGATIAETEPMMRVGDTTSGRSGQSRPSGLNGQSAPDPDKVHSVYSVHFVHSRRVAHSPARRFASSGLTLRLRGTRLRFISSTTKNVL